MIASGMFKACTIHLTYIILKGTINDLGSAFLQSADEHVWISPLEHRDYQSNSLECIY